MLARIVVIGHIGCIVAIDRIVVIDYIVVIDRIVVPDIAHLMEIKINTIEENAQSLLVIP